MALAVEKVITSVQKQTCPVDGHVEEETTRMFFAVTPCRVIGDGIEISYALLQGRAGLG
jgi:hypothetical protein